MADDDEHEDDMILTLDNVFHTKPITCYHHKGDHKNIESTSINQADGRYHGSERHNIFQQVRSTMEPQTLSQTLQQLQRMMAPQSRSRNHRKYQLELGLLEDTVV